jgi:ATP-dependent Clp endopeptidase proteolytic subunit ClpP
MTTKRKSDQEPSAEEKQLFLAQAAQAKAEALKAEHEAEGHKFQTANIRLQYEENKRVTDTVLAGDSYHHVYRFQQEVDELSTSVCMSTLARWARMDPKCDMEIIFNSPGGSSIHGLALYDFLKDLTRKGHFIRTKSQGIAASMAGVLLQAGTVRVMGRESWLLIHEASFGVGGKIGSVDDTVEWVRKMCDRMLDIFSERAAEATHKPVKSVKAFIKKSWTRKDFWVSSDEALKYGFIDEID